MRLRPDFKRTATGYFWLDWLTAPYWAVVDRRSRREFGKLFALKGESWRDGERWVREHWEKPPGQVGEPG